MNLRRPIALASAALLASAGFAIANSPVAAADPSICGVKRIACLYYNSNFKGSGYNQTVDISNYGTRKFYSTTQGTAGKGQYVKNNTASVVNGDRTTPFCVYENSGYRGRTQTIPPDTALNLNSALKNNNAGGSWYIFGSNQGGC